MLRQFLVIFSMSCLAVAGLCPVAWGSQVTAVSTQISDETLIIRIEYDAETDKPSVFALTEGAPRIVIDAKSSGSVRLTKSPLAGLGVLSSIRHAVRGEGTRLVLDMSAKVELGEVRHDGRVTTIALSNATQGDVVMAPLQSEVPIIAGFIPEREYQTSPNGVPVPRVKPKYVSEPFRKPIIAIDPGHGGYDPGAIGGAGTREKVVTLAAALELKKQLLNTGRYEVVLTRSKDIYVVHDERVRAARAIDADLFISIHADSLDKPSTRGASVYTLADYARKRSTRLVDKQNWILDVDLSETSEGVGDILVELAQRSTFSNSDKFAEMLVPELSKVTPILGNTHRRAGLAVLLAPDVPAILLEMGFLSNAEDERALNSEAHRRKIMSAIVTTVDAYFGQ